MSGLFIIGLVSIVNGMDRWSTWLAFVIGLLTYTVAEYFNHRFLFHMETPKNSLMLKFIKRIHVDHHVDPRDLKLLFLPIWYSLPQIIVASLLHRSNQPLCLNQKYITIPITAIKPST